MYLQQCLISSERHTRLGLVIRIYHALHLGNQTKTAWNNAVASHREENFYFGCFVSLLLLIAKSTKRDSLPCFKSRDKQEVSNTEVFHRGLKQV